MPAPKGGPSNNPGGRPKLGAEPRPTLTATVDAANLAWLREHAAAEGLSLGRAVDAAIEALYRQVNGGGKPGA